MKVVQVDVCEYIEQRHSITMELPDAIIAGEVLRRIEKECRDGGDLDSVTDTLKRKGCKVTNVSRNTGLEIKHISIPSYTSELRSESNEV